MTGKEDSCSSSGIDTGCVVNTMDTTLALTQDSGEVIGYLIPTHSSLSFADPRQEEHLGRSSFLSCGWRQHVFGVKILKNRGDCSLH